MELELQEAPERFYFTKGKKKRLFSREKTQQVSLVQGWLSWAGVGYGEGWDGWNWLHHPPDWDFPHQ